METACRQKCTHRPQEDSVKTATRVHPRGAMRYLALASDYDGTLAHDGVVDADTIHGVEQLIHSGRNFILVTGRELPDLLEIFPRLDLCKRIVAENGAVIYDPVTAEKRCIAERPPQSFLNDLRRRGVDKVSVGDVIVATWRPHETQVMEAIRDSGLELQIVFNKDAVMILPSGINKKTGLTAVLKDLNLSRHTVAGVGDAENDHVFLDCCECAVAVANAIPSLKERADLVTAKSHGGGVVELIERMIATDLSELDTSLRGETDPAGAGQRQASHPTPPRRKCAGLRPIWQW